MDDRSELERCLDALYAAVRDSATVDRQAAFDVAMNELEYFPLHAEARELAEASVADDDEPRLASAAAAFQYQSTGRVWPACPAHRLGTSPEARHGTGVWWCDGGDGHVAAEIGHWAGAF
jgi:hypothetical protein